MVIAIQHADLLAGDIGLCFFIRLEQDGIGLWALHVSVTVNEYYR